MLSITMYDSETRIYLDPPLKNLQEIQLLDCNIKTKRLINFKDQQALTDERQGFVLRMPPGTYSLVDIQSIFHNYTDNLKLTINGNNNVGYLFSNKNYNIKLSRDLQVNLGLPEIINPRKIYPININIKEPLRLMCSIVDNRMSYMNKSKNGELLKLTPSQLLANIPSKDYPTITVRKYDTLINHFDLTILDGEWKKFDLGGSPITLSLRFR